MIVMESCMELGTTISVEIGLAVAVITVILFQLSSNVEKKQKISAGIILGLYIFLFGLMAILTLPYLVKLCLAPLSFFDKLFMPNFQMQVSSDKTELFISTQIRYSILILFCILACVVRKHKYQLNRADIITPFTVALNIVIIITGAYFYLNRIIYYLPEFWLNVFYIIFGALIIGFTNRYVRRIANDRCENVKNGE